MKKIITFLFVFYSLSVVSQTSYYVNDNNTAGDVFTSAVGNDLNAGTAAAPFATLVKAMNTALSGDIIYVDAGVYPTINFTINKSVFILGPNYNISPLDATRMEYNTTRNEEAYINDALISIGANDISVKGLVFNPGAKIAISKGNNGLSFSNITIAKNGFLITSNWGGINFFGNSASPAGSNNYIIDDNAFVQNGSSNVQSITLNALDNVTISNNSFLNDDGAPFTQTPIHLGANSLVSNITISHNLIDEPFTGLFSNLIGNITLDNNKIYNSFTSTAVRDGTSTSGTITLKNNYYEINRSLSSLVVQLFGTSPVGTLKKVIVENNTIDINATGFINSPTGYLYAQCNVGIAAAEYVGRKNVINITGNLTGYNGLFWTMRCNGKFNSVNIDNNEVNFNATNLPATSNAYGIVLNLNTGSGNVPPPGSTISINQNKVSGFGRAVQFLGGSLPGVTCNINENSLINNRDLAIVNGNHISPAMNAICNWYGFTNSQSIAAQIFTSTPGGVNYSPWLINGTDQEPLIKGFQPVPGSCIGTAPVVNLTSKTDISCFGDNNGAINITVTGGSTPYTFAWTKDEEPGFSSSSEDLTGLTPGSYDLLVTDANGSTVSLNYISINEPYELTASADGTNNICYGGSLGSATVTAFGGSAPYTYLWSNGATTDEINNLAAGIYSVTVTDDNGCKVSAQYVVIQPTQLTAVATGVSTSCVNSASVVANGGTGDYSYLWSNGATTSSISSIAAGTYSVSVTDENGCTVVANTSVTGNQAFNPSVSVIHVSCFGGSNGILTVTNANGVAPFEYSLDGINFQTGNVFSGLPAGTYTVTVKDALGCTGFNFKTITQPTQLTATLNTVQSACYGQNTGSITVTVSGGTTAYSYQWTGPNGYSSTQLNISGLATGNYAFTVTDNKGCQAILNVVVPSYNQIDVQPTVNNIACKGETNGSIILNVTGGTGNFNYLWNNGATSNSISNLSVGNYSVTITDIGSGCVITRSYSISQPVSAVNISASKTNVTGCANLGTITATAGTSGTAPYSYSIDGISYQSSGSFTGLYAGSYTAWVKDANGCIKSSALLNITDNGTDEFESNNSKTQSKTITIGTTNSARIALATDVADWFRFVTPAGGGNFTLNISHPTASFVINIYPAGNNAPALIPIGAPTATTKEYSLAGNTTYYIQVTGGLSYICYQLSLSAPLITQSSGINLMQEINQQNLLKGIFDVKVFGNPSPTGFVLKVETDNNESMKLRVVDILGRVVETRQHLQPEQMIRFGEKFRAGIYFAEIIQGKNRKLVKLVKM